jgi:hypothetical protein
MSGISAISRNFESDAEVFLEVNTTTTNNVYIQIDADVGGTLKVFTRIGSQFEYVQLSSTVIADATPSIITLIDTAASTIKIQFTPTALSVFKIGVCGK